MSNPVIQAKETKYKGYRFRSRLEARWAVFFDAMGIKWEYEKEGFDLGKVGSYLPDFWLPQIQAWAEVKGQIDTETVKKPLALAQIHCPVLILSSLDGNDYIPGECALIHQQNDGVGGLDVKHGFLRADGESVWFVTRATGNSVAFAENINHFREWAYSHPVAAKKYYQRSIQALITARSARFEHGEQGR